MSDKYKEGYRSFLNGEYKEAINHLLYVDNKEKYPKVFYYLGYSYFQIGDYIKSREYSEIYFRYNPRDVVNAKILILSCLSLGSLNEAKNITDLFISQSNDLDDDIIKLYEKLNNKDYFSDFSFPKLNILFIQESVGIRCYKFAKALISKGHKVSLVYIQKKASDIYKGLDDSIFEICLKINNIQEIGNIGKSFDIIQCHNEPDYLTLAALSSGRPVIHDTADLISLRDIENPNTKFFEGLANRLASGRVYSTVYQKNEAEILYDINSPSIVFGNYIAENDRPKTFLSKLSGKDNKIHIVYQGSISVYKHRNFIDIFITLVKQGFVVHIYPATFNKELSDFFNGIPNIKYYEPISPNYLLTELTKYDIGIIPWNLDLGQKRFLDSTIANKLFEYLAAGLPVITSDVKSYREYFSINKVGFVLESFENIQNKLYTLITQSKHVDLTKYSLSYENEIYKLEKFYFDVLKANNTKIINQKDTFLLKDFYNSRTISKVKNTNIITKHTLTGDVLLIVQSVESVGGGAITLKEIIEEFRFRGSKVFLLTSKISDDDLINITSGIEEVFYNELFFSNVRPLDEEINKLNLFISKLIEDKNIEIIISLPFFISFFIQFPQNKLLKIIYYITYEPNFSGENLDIKRSFILNNYDRLVFINKPGIKLFKSYFNLDISNIHFNYVGIPIKDYKSLLKYEKNNFFNDGFLSIIIISRFAPTKSFILNAIEDLSKLILSGYPIKVTILGEGVLKELLSVIISYYSVQDSVKFEDASYPMNYEELIKYDFSIATGTTAIITAALGIPTLMALPTLWFEYFGYFSGYAGTLGIVGDDYDYFQDSLFPINQKYTYFDFIKSIFELEDIQGYLKTLSERSKEYCEKYEKYFDRSKIVNSMLYNIENKNS